MTEFHQIDDSAESALDFLRKLSDNAIPIAGSKEQRSAPRLRRPRNGAPRAASFPLTGATVGSACVAPWLSASASLPVWGAGQWLNGQRSLGLLFATLQAFALAVYYCLSNTWESWMWLADILSIPRHTVRVVLFGVGGLLPLLAVSVAIQAYYRAARHPRARVFSGPAVFPSLASALVPGWGQLLNDQIGKAATFGILATSSIYAVGVSLRFPEFWSGLDATPRPLAGVPLTAITLGAVALGALAWIVSVYDAHLTARQQRD